MKVAKHFLVREIEGDIGVEIEVEGNGLYRDDNEFWAVEADGSLRGESAEYVLHEPKSLDGVEEALDFLNDKFDRWGSELILSRRTSTHIHINVTQMDVVSLSNFIVLLYTFEDFLVNWCQDTRKGNFYCLRSRDAEEVIGSVNTFLQTGRRGQFNDNIRYSAINLASLNKYGSVEIRCLEGTVDKERILTWCSVLLQLREVAKTYQEPVEIIQEMSDRGDVPFAKKVLGNHYKEFFKGKGRKALLIDCIRRAQDLAFSFNPKWIKPNEGIGVNAFEGFIHGFERVHVVLNEEGVEERVHFPEDVIRFGP